MKRDRMETLPLLGTASGKQSYGVATPVPHPGKQRYSKGVPPHPGQREVLDAGWPPDLNAVRRLADEARSTTFRAALVLWAAPF